MKVQELIPEISPYMNELEKKLKQVMSSKVEAVNDIACYLQKSSGKRLRPALFLLVTNGYNEDSRNVLSIAVAIELIHAATLVHDDVVDRSDLRRGLPTISSKWGNDNSVLIGDYLFAKAFRLLTEYGNHDLINIFAKVIEEMSIGEIEQLTDVFNVNLTEEDYIKRIIKKTAIFISGACKAGGVVRRVNSDELLALYQYGLNLGIAFQIQDDILNFKGCEEVTGKPVGNDIRHGVITMPVIQMLRKTKEKDYFLTNIANRNIKQQFLTKIVSEVNNTGSLDYSYQQAEAFTQKALQSIQRIENSKLKDTLTKVATIANKRNF